MLRIIDYLSIRSENTFYVKGLQELISDNVIKHSPFFVGTVTLLILPDDTLSCLDNIASMLATKVKGEVIVLGSPLQKRLLFGLLKRKIRITPKEKNLKDIVIVIQRYLKQEKNPVSDQLLCEKKLYKFLEQTAGYYDSHGFQNSVMNNCSGKYTLIKRARVNNSNELHMKYLLAHTCIAKINSMHRARKREQFRGKQKLLLAENQVFKTLTDTGFAQTFLGTDRAG
jgi:hypothetical protein